MLAGELGEEALLKELRGIFAPTSPGTPVAIGDDAAVIDNPAGFQGVWTTDLLLEGVHFQKDWQTPRELGKKSLAVNLSDLAAMGAEPGWALLSLAFPPETEAEYILELCRGLAEQAAAHGVAVVGGDTTSNPWGLVISVAAGGAVPAGAALTRSGAAPGDAILVTGFVGSAAGGLRLLREGGGETCAYPVLVEAFIRPAARLAAAAAARQAGASAMTDISDGIASDLRHICEESACGARVVWNNIPIHDQLAAAADRYSWPLADMALAGGEDYELLFTVPAEKAAGAAKAITAETGVPVTVIGDLVAADRGILLLGPDGSLRPLPVRGFDHFRHE